MLLVVGVVVVGGEDALAVAEEGQAVAGELGYEGAAVLIALVAQGCLGVLEQIDQWCSGGAVLDGAGDGAQEVAAGAGDVIEGDGDLSAGVTALGGEGDAFGSLGDGALGVGQLTAAVATTGGGGCVLLTGAAGGGQGDFDASVGGAGLVGGVLDLGLGLALAGDGCLPLVELGELLESGLDGVGALLGPDS